MRFRILGPVEARAEGGEPVRLPPKPRVLLAVLLVHAGRPVSRDRLMAAVWPQEAPPSAPRVIRTYVSALRRSLRVPRQDGLPRLAALDDAYCLEVAPGDLDMLVFDDLTERGRRALGDGDAATAARLLDQALGLWHGPPAGDVIVDGDTGAVLAGLAERRLLAEEDRADAELALGRDAALIARLRLLVATYPLRERPWGQLMTALYRTGQRAAALACYRQLREHLVAELGVEPGPELAELHQQILGESYRAIGEPGTSADCFRRALSVRQHTGDRHGQAQTLRALGDLLQELREADAAHASWQQALAIFEELGDPQASELRARLRALGHTKCRRSPACSASLASPGACPSTHSGRLLGSPIQPGRRRVKR